MSVLLSVFFAVTTSAHANSMLKEMSNAVELGSGDGPKDELVSFTLHFGADKPVVVTGKDYDSYKLYQTEDLPTQLELYAGKGDDKHNILINIAAARYYRLNIAKKDKDWHYDFEFYF
jgi:hypothetical protein